MNNGKTKKLTAEEIKKIKEVREKTLSEHNDVKK
jgi:hypothetical protein